MTVFLIKVSRSDSFRLIIENVFNINTSKVGFYKYYRYICFEIKIKKYHHIRVCVNFCKNCGAEYHFQASGSYWSLNTPEKLNDWDYCPECKKAIIEALSPIIKKTELRYVGCDDFTINEILEFERIEGEKTETPSLGSIGTSKIQFPRMRRVFAKLVNIDDPNDPINFETTNEIKINKISYIYTYNRKSTELIRLNKEVRWDLIKDCLWN